MKIEERHHYVIAIADDDQRVLQSLGNLLESAGYSVRLFESADAFLQSGEIDGIDALVSDIRMPGVDGIELQRRVGIMRPALPVVLITARNDMAPLRGAQPNNRGVFGKPIDPTAFLLTLAEVLRG